MSTRRPPPWWSWLLLLLGSLLFLRLGYWQLDRASEKEQLLRRYAAAALAPRQSLAAVAAANGVAPIVRVAVEGRYLTDRIYLLDNPRHDSRGGVEVYTPLRLDDSSRLLLVDLGFLVGDGSGRTPQLPAPPVGKVSLQGLYLPPPGVGYRMGGDALATQSHWPKTTVYLDLKQLASDLGAPLYPSVLALDGEPGSIYQREHQLDFSAMPPARHRAYAFQWFTFALAAWVIFAVLYRPRRFRKDA